MADPLLRAEHLIRINGAEYTLEPHGQGVWLLLRQFARLPYVVGATVCTCPDYAFNRAKAGEACKHLAALRMIGLLPEPEAQPPDDRDALADQRG